MTLRFLLEELAEGGGHERIRRECVQLGGTGFGCEAGVSAVHTVLQQYLDDGAALPGGRIEIEEDSARRGRRRRAPKAPGGEE